MLKDIFIQIKETLFISIYIKKFKKQLSL